MYDKEILFKLLELYPKNAWQWRYIEVNEKFVEKHPDYPWNWNELSETLSIEFIEKHLNYPWKKLYLSGNKNITLDFILKHEDKIVYTSFCLSTPITLEFIEDHLDKDWDWCGFSHDAPFEFVTKHLDKDWVLSNLLYNENIPPEFFEKCIFGEIQLPFSEHFYSNLSSSSKLTEKIIFAKSDMLNWSKISHNEKTTMKFIEDNLNFPWDWDMILFNPNLTTEFIRNHANSFYRWLKFDMSETLTGILKECWWLKCDFIFKLLEIREFSWAYPFLSSSPEITLEFIHKNIDKKFYMYELSKNPVVTMDYVEANIYHIWNFRGLSFNPNLTLEFLEKYYFEDWAWETCPLLYDIINLDFFFKYPTLSYNWHYLSKAPFITPEIIESFEKPWNWNGVSENPNLTLKFIKKHIDKINFKNLSNNKFLSNKKSTAYRNSQILKILDIFIITEINYIILSY